MEVWSVIAGESQLRLVINLSIPPGVFNIRQSQSHLEDFGRPSWSYQAIMLSLSYSLWWDF